MGAEQQGGRVPLNAGTLLGPAGRAAEGAFKVRGAFYWMGDFLPQQLARLDIFRKYF